MRIFIKSGSAVSEVSKELNSYTSGATLATIASTDAIYLAVDFPMNHFYLKMGTVLNTESSVMSVQYWNGEDWISSVHVNDYTDALSNSGMVEFTPDRDEAWMRDDTNDNGNEITDLSSIKVYDKYWIKIKFSASLTAAIELLWIGNLFSTDSDLLSEFPIFNDSSFMLAFKAGKTSWEEQHVKAAELIIQDLKRRNVIIGPEQILEYNLLLPASVCKTAEIIYNAFGNDYLSQRDSARAEYKQRCDLSKFILDTNSNGIVDHYEVSESQGWLSR